MKYITVDGHLHTEFYIFSSSIEHSSFVHRMNFKPHEVLSAGFVDLEDQRCYGKSISLGKEAGPMDTVLLRKMAM